MRNDSTPGGVFIDVGDVDMTLTKMSTGSLTVAPGTSSVELLNVKLSSNTDFEVSNFYLNFITGGLSLANFVDGTVTAYIDGIDYEITTGTTTFSTSADRFLVGNDDSATIRVVGNLKSTATTGVQYKMEFEVTEIKNIDNGNTIGGLTFSKAGDIVTVNNGTFTVTKPSTVPTNKTVLEGSASDMLYFNLKAIAENQTLKSVKVTSTVGFTGYATQIALMQGDLTIKAENDEANLSGLTYTFDNLSKELTKGTSVPFTVRVTLKNGEVTTLGTNVQLSIAATTDVVVKRAVEPTTYTTSSSAAVSGTDYQISSSLPVISLPEQNGIYTKLDIQNKSNYDVVLVTVKADMKADY